MKNLLKCIIAISIFLVVGFNNKTSSITNEVSKKIIRFHVIANSDLDKDQELKLKIKDEVLRYIQPKLNKCTSIEESRKVLICEDNNIKNIAKRVIKENMYDYHVTTKLSFENFPIKTYGNITLPKGRYESYKIIIGEGEGRNWWCVMFPPLCFVDVTKGSTSDKETEEKMKSVLNKKEYESIDNRKNKKINVKFKITEVIENILK